MIVPYYASLGSQTRDHSHAATLQISYARLLGRGMVEGTMPLDQCGQLRQVLTARNHGRSAVVISLKSGWQDLAQLFL